VVTTALHADRRTLRVAVVVGAVAVVLAPAAAALPLHLLTAALVAVVLAAVAYAHPPAAAYLVLVVTPLSAGFPRGLVAPQLRPHEALALVVGAGVVLRAVVRLGSTRRVSARLGPIDVAFLIMAFASSVLPLLWMAARGMAPTREDLLYAAAIWKFYGLYLLIRTCLSTEREVRRCLYLSISAAGVVAVVAILQSLNLAGVPDLLARLLPPEDATGLAAGRGSATLGSSISVGDVMAFHVAICLALLVRGRASRRVLLPCIALFTIGTVASGQFSAVIAVVVCVVIVALVTGQAKRLLVGALPAAALTAVLLWPVIAQRLAQRDVATGVPQSWHVRYENLRLYVWPELFSGENWLFGVRPSTRIEVSTPWGSEIYIESGHTWLLWTGGIAFLVAYLWFMLVALRTTWWIAGRRRDAVGVAAIASLASLAAVFVLMAFDPHLTMRGAADLTYALLALATAVPTPAAAGQPVRAVGVARPGSTSYT
jgi:hypothetical protein